MTNRKHWKKLSTKQLNKVLLQLRQQKSKTVPLFWWGLILTVFATILGIGFLDVLGLVMVLTDIGNYVYCDVSDYKIRTIIEKRAQNGRKE